MIPFLEGGLARVCNPCCAQVNMLDVIGTAEVGRSILDLKGFPIVGCG